MKAARISENLTMSIIHLLIVCFFLSGCTGKVASKLTDETEQPPTQAPIVNTEPGAFSVSTTISFEDAGDGSQSIGVQNFLYEISVTNNLDKPVDNLYVLPAFHPRLLGQLKQSGEGSLTSFHITPGVTITIKGNAFIPGPKLTDVEKEMCEPLITAVHFFWREEDQARHYVFDNTFAKKVGPDWEEEARRVIVDYFKVCNERNDQKLVSLIWRYAGQSAGTLPVSGQVQRIIPVTFYSGGGERIGFNKDIIPTEVFIWYTYGQNWEARKEKFYFTLVQEQVGSPWQIAEIYQERPKYENSLEQEELVAAEDVVKRYFEALERQDFRGAGELCHQTWSDQSARPDKNIKKLKLNSISPGRVDQVGIVKRIHFAVDTEVTFKQMISRHNGLNTYFVSLIREHPEEPFDESNNDWRLVCAGTGP